jgi:hypothetical protein
MSKKECPALLRGAKGKLDTAAPLNPNLIPSKGDAIRAELVGDDTAEACGYYVQSLSPVLTLCRDLSRCFRALPIWKTPTPNCNSAFPRLKHAALSIAACFNGRRVIDAALSARLKIICSSRSKTPSRVSSRCSIRPGSCV